MPDQSSTDVQPNKFGRPFLWCLNSTGKLVMGGILGWAAVRSFQVIAGREGEPTSSPIETFFLVVLAGITTTTADELGHLVAARLVGFRLALFSVFALSLSRGPRGWRMGLGRGLGQCLAYPTDTRDLRRGFAFAAFSALVPRLGIVASGQLDTFHG